VAKADPAIRQARHLDAVAVGEAQWALDPGWFWTRLSRAARVRQSSHVVTSLNVVSPWPGGGDHMV